MSTADPTTFVPPPDWEIDPPDDLETIANLLNHYENDITRDNFRGRVLRRLFDVARRKFDSAARVLKEAHPEAFFLPSYEQALLLNSWMWGINFPLCFAANRIGKTTAFVFNGILWLFPNNPQWLCFRPHVDEWGRTVQIFPRPKLSALLELQALLKDNPNLAGDPYQQPYEGENIEKIATLQRYLPEAFQPCFPAPPIQQGGQIWLGAPDSDFHKHIIMPRWRSLLPKESILSDNNTDKYFIITTRSETNPTTTVHQIICKSYESEDTKWSGDAVQGIILTEGFDQAILDEVKNRVTNESFASWDYTPAEARNVGRKVALAYRVYKKEEPLPLHSFAFINFDVQHTPDRIIPKEKKADMIRMWAGRKEGDARVSGKFFSSSGLILEHLDKDHHCLPWSLEQLLNEIPGGQFYRGVDPGLDHPAACAWGYLTPQNVWFIYRFYSKRGTTITERCKDIIELSNNEREMVTIAGLTFWREVHPYPNSEVFVATKIDYHIFKEDEQTGTSYSNNYTNEGLIVSESTHMRPENRAQKANNLFDKNTALYLPHPITHRPPGSKVYFLINELGVAQAVEKYDNLFWDRFKAGDNRGQPKDKVPIHGDDEFDAFCYIVCDNLVWTRYTPPRRQPRDAEPDLLQRTTEAARLRRDNHGLSPEAVTRIQQRQLALSNLPGHFG